MQSNLFESITLNQCRKLEWKLTITRQSPISIPYKTKGFQVRIGLNYLACDVIFALHRWTFEPSDDSSELKLYFQLDSCVSSLPYINAFSLCKERRMSTKWCRRPPVRTMNEVNTMNFLKSGFTEVFVMDWVIKLWAIYDQNFGKCYNQNWDKQKQPPKGVPRKRCSENMQQIYSRTPMPKCDFKNVDCNFIEIALRDGCPTVNLLHIFRIPFLKNPSGWLLLNKWNHCQNSKLRFRNGISKTIVPHFAILTYKTLVWYKIEIEIEINIKTLNHGLYLSVYKYIRKHLNKKKYPYWFENRVMHVNSLQALFIAIISTFLFHRNNGIY